jgi:putative effector of murein hydrolase
MTDLLDTPAFAIVITLGTWVGALQLQRLSRLVFNPVLTSTVVIIVALLILDVPYSDYRDGVSGLILLLGPAIVALAVPVRRHRRLARTHARTLIPAVMLGTVAGIGSTIALATALGLTNTITVSLAPKHATSAVSAATVSVMDGTESLAAVASILTGIVGAAVGIPLLRLVRVRDATITGLTLGVSSHAIGTARAFDEGDSEGAIAVVGLVLAAILVPVVIMVMALDGLLPTPP